MASKKFRDSMENVKNNLWCGFTITEKQRDVLTLITLAEFRVPIKDRRQPYELVDEARKIVKQFYKTNK